MSEFIEVLIILCDFTQWQWMKVWFSKTGKKCETIKDIQRARRGDTAELVSF